MYFLFIGGSGYDPGPSPYEVLAGVVVEDRDLWNLVQAMVDAEVRHFGRRLGQTASDVRARQLLKKKVFRLGRQLRLLRPEDRRSLAKACLDSPGTARIGELTALAQAKLAYVGEVLDLCARFRCRFLASIVNKTSPVPGPDQLRKDYAYLFERFFYLLDDLKPSPNGIVVGDSRQGARSHLLATQMAHYFRVSPRGRQRAALVVPEPLFAHGELAAGLEAASIVAYLTSWGFRTKELVIPERRELKPLIDQVRTLRFRVVRDMGDNPNFVVWGFSVIHDLRMREDREGLEA